MPKTVDVTIKGKDETKPAFDSAEQTAKSFGERFKSGILNPMTAIQAGVAAVAASVVTSFAKASVESAAAADAAWGRVESAVTNLGISFAGTKSQLDKLFTKIQETTRYSDDDAATAFSTLVTISGDYAGSIKNLNLAADIAAKKQIGIAEAAEVVGKVMAGETGMLKRYGIVLKDGADAMQTLRDKFNGFAERDAGTLEGKIKQIANAWDNVKEAIGRALTGDSQNGMSAFADTLNHVGQWIDEHREGIHEIVTDLLKLAENLPQMVHGRWWLEQVGLMNPKDKGQHPTMAWKDTSIKVDPQTEAQIAENARKAAADRQAKADEDAAKALDKRIADLKKEGDLLLGARDTLALSAADTQKLADINLKLLKISQDQNEPLRVRVAAYDFLKKQADALNDLEKQRLERDLKMAELERSGMSVGALAAQGVHVIGENRINGPGPTAAPMPTIGGPSGGPGATSLVGQRMQQLLGGAEGFKGLDESLGDLDQKMQDLTAGSLTNFFDAWQGGIADVIQGHEKMGVVIPRVLRRAVGGALAADAQDTLFRAAKAFALGLTDPTGIHLGQAAKLFAIGTAESAAAAALMSGGGGGGGGYGGGGVSPAGFSQSQSAVGGRGGPATVIVNGRYLNVDFRDPEQRDDFKRMFEQMYGNREISFQFTED